MDRPPVLVLLADQLRRDVLGCYGGQFGVSPHLDAFADESVVLDSHVTTCPLCVPARNSIITGTWPHVHGAIVNAWDEAERPYGTCRNVPTLYESLAEGGYAVEHVGVDHLRCEPPLSDRHSGIRFRGDVNEHRSAMREAGIVPDVSECRSPCVDFSSGEPVTRWYTNPNPSLYPGKAEDFLDVFIADHVEQVIRSADGSRPLALFGNYWLPHCPISCPEPYYSMYDPDALELPDDVGEWLEGRSPMQLVNLPGHVAASVPMDTWRKTWAVYLGMVRFLDDCVGRVLAVLKDCGFWDDALVIISSDHGEMLGSGRMFQKMCMYEDAVRVAMMVKPPGGGVTGRRRQLTDHTGLAATICEYTGTAVPQASVGRAFRDVVEDPKAPGAEVVFSEFNGNSGRGFQQRAVITPTHKYIHNHGYAPELYDLQADPRERENLCQAEHVPSEAGQLRNRLREWMIETGDCIAPPEC